MLRQVVDANRKLPVLDNASTTKIAQALSALQRSGDDQTAARRAVGRVPAMMRSKNVLHDDMEHEIFKVVFRSLRELRDALADAYAEIVVTGPEQILAVIDAMLTAVRSYLGRHEGSLKLHDQAHPSPVWHVMQAEWPGLPRASLELLALRETLAALVYPLNHCGVGQDLRNGQGPRSDQIGLWDFAGSQLAHPPSEHNRSLSDAYRRRPPGSAAAGVDEVPTTVLSTALGSRLSSLRIAAFEELAERAKRGETDAARPLLDALDDEHEDLAARARAAVHAGLPNQAGESRHLPTLTTLALEWQQVWWTERWWGDVRTSSAPARSGALRLLASWAGQPSVALAFIRALADGVPFDQSAVRQAIGASANGACRMLAALLDEPRWSELADLFADAESDLDVRRAVLATLAGGDAPDSVGDWSPNIAGSRQRPTEPVADLLRTSLADRDALVRYTTIRAVWLCLDAGNAAELLVEASRDADRLVRARAAFALGGLPGSATVRRLRPLLQDVEPAVAKAAVHALRNAAVSGVPIPAALLVYRRTRNLMDEFRERAYYEAADDTWRWKTPGEQ
ncbi:HEAT repeat domain-containing protein [Streptomyces sp. NPDC093099]|uniref:HEAT repeat domain-containing protein n=1 Tax=Streptomyces sp. NPDC093099 TaxID=3366028 RepID=UPI0037F8BA30